MRGRHNIIQKERQREIPTTSYCVLHTLPNALLIVINMQSTSNNDQLSPGLWTVYFIKQCLAFATLNCCSVVDSESYMLHGVDTRGGGGGGGGGDGG